MEAAQRVVTAVRSLRADYGLVREKTAVSLACADAALAAGLAECAPLIATLSTASSVTLLQVSRRSPSPKPCNSGTAPSVTVLQVGQSVSHSVSRSVDQSVSLSVGQSVSRSVSRSVTVARQHDSSAAL